MSAFERLALDSMQRAKRQRTAFSQRSFEESERQKEILRASSRLTKRLNQSQEIKLPYLSKTNMYKAQSQHNFIPIDSTFKFSSFPKRQPLKPPPTTSFKIRLPSAKYVNELTDKKKNSMENSDPAITRYPVAPVNINELSNDVQLVSHYGICISKLLGD